MKMDTVNAHTYSRLQKTRKRYTKPHSMQLLSLAVVRPYMSDIQTQKSGKKLYLCLKFTYRVFQHVE